MARHFQIWMALAALGIALVAGTAQAGNKGFSMQGGKSFSQGMRHSAGGQNFQPLKQSSPTLNSMKNFNSNGLSHKIGSAIHTQGQHGIKLPQKHTTLPHNLPGKFGQTFPSTIKPIIKPHLPIVGGVKPHLPHVEPHKQLGGGFPQNNHHGQQGHHGNGHAQGNHSCHHVIQIMVKNCVKKPSCYDPCLRRYYVDPVWVQLGCLPAPVVQQVGAPSADLELLQVGLVAEGAPNAGPIYAVTFRNKSLFDLPKFKISLVAVLGEIEEASPLMTVEAPALTAGAVTTLHIQLPPAALAMGPAGQPAPFDTLVVALDSFEEIAETDEFNNVATLKRIDIPAAAAQTPQP